MTAKALEFGVLLPTRGAVMGKSSPPDPSPLLAMATEAEELGYDSVWVGDSLLARPRFEALTTLAAAAARTRRVKLGTAIYLSPLRNPVLLANTAANLDLLSGGRLILGLGVGTRSPSVISEFANCGVPFDHRTGRLQEGVEIMRRLWRGEQVDFRGEHYDLHGCALGLRPRQPSGPPIWLAGKGENAYRRVALLADGWLPISPNPEAFAAGWARIRALAAATGRPEGAILPALYVTLSAHADRERAAADLKAYMEAYYGVPYSTMSKIQGCCAGTPEECARWLAAFLRQGPRCLVLRFASAEPEEQMRLFAREILPMLNS